MLDCSDLDDERVLILVHVYFARFWRFSSQGVECRRFAHAGVVILV